jgi:hypothetical protein
VLASVLPTYAIAFFVQNGLTGFFVLGAVFLVVTGGEAFYAGMGHFSAHRLRSEPDVQVLRSKISRAFACASARRSRNRPREISRAPSASMWGVITWQSIRVEPRARR